MQFSFLYGRMSHRKCVDATFRPHRARDPTLTAAWDSGRVYYTQTPAEKVPSEVAQSLCLLLGYPLEEFPALHRHIGCLLRQYGRKLHKLYLVLSPDNGAIITVAYRS